MIDEYTNITLLKAHLMAEELSHGQPQYGSYGGLKALIETLHKRTECGNQYSKAAMRFFLAAFPCPADKPCVSKYDYNLIAMALKTLYQAGIVDKDVLLKVVEKLNGIKRGMGERL